MASLGKILGTVGGGILGAFLGNPVMGAQIGGTVGGGVDAATEKGPGVAPNKPSDIFVPKQQDSLVDALRSFQPQQMSEVAPVQTAPIKQPDFITPVDNPGLREQFNQPSPPIPGLRSQQMVDLQSRKRDALTNKLQKISAEEGAALDLDKGTVRRAQQSEAASNARLRRALNNPQLMSKGAPQNNTDALMGVDPTVDISKYEQAILNDPLKRVSGGPKASDTGILKAMQNIRSTPTDQASSAAGGLSTNDLISLGTDAAGLLAEVFKKKPSAGVAPSAPQVQFAPADFGSLMQLIQSLGPRS